MAFHQDITRKDTLTLALDAANSAVRIASKQLTGNAGTVEVPNADGTSTIMGVGAGDTGVAPWVGDTTAPGKPSGITAESHNGAIWVSWDGTLDGGVPADFDHVQFTAVDGSKTVNMGQLRAAGKVTAAELTAGDTAVVTAVAFDDAHDAQGNSTPNASVPSDPVTVVVQSAVDAAAVQKAKDDAQSALDKAGQAVDTADGKNNIFSSVTQPSSTGLVPGDMWFQLDSSKNVSGIQVWNGSAFTDMVLLANKLLVASSVGTTQIADNAIVTGKIAANAITAIKIAAQTITGDKLDVGSVAAAIITSGLFKTTDGSYGFDSTNGFWAGDTAGTHLALKRASNGISQLAIMHGTDVISSLSFNDTMSTDGYVHTGISTGQGGQFLEFATLVDDNYPPNPLSYDTRLVAAGGTGLMSIDAQNAVNISGMWFAHSVNNLPKDPRVVGGVGTKAFAGGVRYSYDGGGAWNSCDTTLITTNLTDFFTPAPGWSEATPGECAFIISNGIAHVTFNLTGTLPENVYTEVGTLKEGYRPVRPFRTVGTIAGGYTYGGYTTTAGVFHIGNRTGADRTWLGVDCTFQLA